MRQILLAFTFLNLFLGYLANGQVVISGLITDKSNGEGVRNATITLNTIPSGEMIAYGITDSIGRYSIVVNQKVDSMLAIFSCLGFTTQQHLLKGKLKSWDVAMSPEAISIHEVTVKANKVWARGDTINYAVSGFVSKQDRTIEDVIKKLPGIDVAKNGVIYYAGKPISALYIEGMNSMDGKYSLATENIPVDAIANVQIFENHQNIKVLENSSFSDRAALNLTLKEGEKYRWIGNAQLGTGLPLALWNGNLFLMNVSKKNQGINILKTNNEGVNIGSQLKTITLEDLLNENTGSEKDADLFSLPDISIPSLTDKRFLFNKTFLASTNNTWMLNEDWLFRLNISCLKDRVSQTSSLINTYFFPNDSSLVVDDERVAVKNQLLLDAGMTLTANTSTLYFNDALKFVGDWDSSSVNGSGSSNYNEKFETPTRSIQNSLRMIKKLGTVNVSFYNFSKFTYQPQQLNIAQDIPDTVFEGRLNFSNLVQTATSSKFLSNTEASFTLAKGKWYLENNFRTRLRYETYTSGLKSSMISDAAFSTHFKWERFRTIFAPKLGFNGKRFRMELIFPLNYDVAAFNDELVGKTLHFEGLNLTPELNLRYKISKKLEIFSRLSSDNSIDEPTKFSAGYALVDFRNIVQGSSFISEQKSKSYMVGFFYRNPVAGLFINSAVSYSPMLSETSVVQTIRGIYIVNSTVLRSNSSNLWLVTSRVSKSLDVFKSTASLEFSYSQMSTALLQNTTPIQYRNLSYTISPKINARPFLWLEVDYKGQLSTSQLQIDFSNVSHQPYLYQVYQDLTIAVNLWKNTQIMLQSEHFYNELIAGKSPSLLFCDLGFRMKFNRFEFMSGWNNIFNRKAYAYSSYGSLNSTFNSYVLRPTNITCSISFKF